MITLEWNKVYATVVGAQHDRVHRINAIRILRIRGNLAKIPPALPDTRVGTLACPRGAGVIGTIQPARVAIDERIHTLRRRRGDRQANATNRGRKSMRRDLCPVITAIDGFVQPAAGSVRWWINIPGRAPRLPQRGIDHVRIIGLEGEVDRARIIILAEYLLSAPATVTRTINTAFGIRPVRMAKRGYIDQVRIARMHEDLADLL